MSFLFCFLVCTPKRMKNQKRFGREKKVLLSFLISANLSEEVEFFSERKSSICLSRKRLPSSLLLLLYSLLWWSDMPNTFYLMTAFCQYNFTLQIYKMWHTSERPCKGNYSLVIRLNSNPDLLFTLKHPHISSSSYVALRELRRKVTLKKYKGE